jgi:sec-independent protein translocase protein TatB
MFDLTSSKLLLLAVVALLVIGPKDFPILLRTIGKYMGIIRGHAKEFRAQFDEAMRDSEIGQIKKDMESFGRETEASLTATKQSVEQTFAEARQGVETSVVAPAEATPKAAADPLAEAAASPAASEALPPTTPGPAPAASEADPTPSPATKTATAAPAVERTGA